MLLWVQPSSCFVPKPYSHFSVIQFLLLGCAALNASLSTWWLNTNSSWYYINLIFVVYSYLGYFYWALSFYMSVRANVPKFISTKNVTGLFGFTLVFVEALVLSALVWI